LEAAKADRQKRASVPVGEVPEVPDADKPLREDVKEETAQELIRGQWHHAFYASMSPVSPAEGNFSILERDEAMVGNGHSMRVAAEIAENMLWAAEGPFDMQDPVLAIEFADKGVKSLRVREMLQFAVKADLALGECVVEGILHLSAEHLSEHLLRQKEPAALCRYPAPVIEGQSAGRDDAVHVRMMLHFVSPGMEHAEKADFGAEVLGIAGNFDQRFGAEVEAGWYSYTNFAGAANTPWISLFLLSV